jgi:hypothetical protein
MITTSHDTDYMLNKVEGNVTIRELLGFAQANVDTWLSRPVLWDLTDATLKEDKSDHDAIRGIVSKSHNLVNKRKGEKTVFVAPDSCSYGMLRMAIALVEIKVDWIVASVFYDIESAEAWLKED